MAVAPSGDHCASFLLGTCGVFERFSALGVAMLCNLITKGRPHTPIANSRAVPSKQLPEVSRGRICSAARAK